MSRVTPTSSTAGPQPTTNFKTLPWPDRVALVTRMMREVSAVRTPQEMVDVYGGWVQALTPVDRFVSLSRRDLTAPNYRITRSGLWEEQNREFDPWKERAPMFDSGILGDLIYGQEAVILDDFVCPPGDVACEHIDGFKSLLAVPLFEDGVAVNMIVILRKDAGGFDPEELPNRVWNSNLFGRATKNLVLSEELRRAYDHVDRELKVVADIQRSLLPKTLPQIPGLDLAVHYQTSTQSGGDYYDFFELSDGRLGILIADVSGHGTPAAVMMAVTHSIAHTRERPPAPPHELISFINKALCERYTTNGTFVTAFYGVYDPRDRSMRYCNAGHNPPIVRRLHGERGDKTFVLDQNGGLPLGIIPDEEYEDATATLHAGDVLICYTDGITEARRAGGDVVVEPGETDELFGTDRLERIVKSCVPDALSVVQQTIKAVNLWTDFAPAKDDRTLVVGRFS